MIQRIVKRVSLSGLGWTTGRVHSRACPLPLGDDPLPRPPTHVCRLPVSHPRTINYASPIQATAARQAARGLATSKKLPNGVAVATEVRTSRVQGSVS